MKNRTICIWVKNEYLIIPVEKIVYCRADGSYSKFMLDDGSEYLISKSLGFVERYLKNNNFIRCHNSYLINAMKIEKYCNKLKLATVLGYNIPVSRRKYRKVIVKMKNFNIKFKELPVIK